MLLQYEKHISIKNRKKNEIAIKTLTDLFFISEHIFECEKTIL